MKRSIFGLKFIVFATILLALGGCVPTAENLFVTSITSNPLCDGSGVNSGTGPLSVGGTGGCISSVSAELEANAQKIRNSDFYRAQTVDHYVGTTPIRSNGLIAGGFDYAHALNLTGAEQTIAIYDAGFNATHLEFWDKPIVYGNGQNSATLFIDAHGTAVAALAAGTAQYGETVGAAPNASLYLSSWNQHTDDGTVRDAESLNAIVLNNSWGFTCTGDLFDECGINDYNATTFRPSSYRTALENYAGDEGIVVFAASNQETQTQSTMMAALPQQIPSLEEGWLAVINLARDYDPTQPNLFDDTNVGQMSSGCLEAARWCVAADGTAYIATSNWNGYEYGTGTSYAAPRVSAAIAILAEAFPNLTPSEIRNRLIVTADNAFFAADTANIQTMTFAAGLTHDYHWIYGHGFIDLKAALLPIGAAKTTTAKGEEINLNAPTILAGGASGDAIRTALSKVTLYATDLMGGTFDASGTTLVALNGADGKDVRALNQLGSAAPDNALSVQTPIETAAGVLVPIDFDAASLEMRLPQSDSGSVGLRLSKAVETSTGRWTLGLSGLRDQSSLLGLSLGSIGTITSDQVALDASYSTALAPDLNLTLKGHAGQAQAAASGFFDGFDRVTYAALGATLTQANAFRAGDSLAFFANQPTAIQSGSAHTSLKLASSDSSSSYSNVDIPLSPSERETEIGMEYRKPGQSGEDWVFKVSHRFNASNIAGNDVSSVLLGVSKQF